MTIMGLGEECDGMSVTPTWGQKGPGWEEFGCSQGFLLEDGTKAMLMVLSPSKMDRMRMEMITLALTVNRSSAAMQENRTKQATILMSLTTQIGQMLFGNNCSLYEMMVQKRMVPVWAKHSCLTLVQPLRATAFAPQGWLLVLTFKAAVLMTEASLTVAPLYRVCQPCMSNT